MATLRKRQRFVGCNQNVIQQPDIDHGQGLLQMTGQRQISLAGFQPPTGVVMTNDDRSRIGSQCHFDDLAGPR